jgi:hypothetical protein
MSFKLSPQAHPMKNRRIAFVATTLACVFSISAQAEVTDVRWSADNAHQHSASIAPKKVVEVCGKLNAGEAVTWEYRADAALDFNIHHHVGKDVFYATRQKATAASNGTLDVTTAQEYCWMWKNTSEKSVQVDVKLRKAPLTKQ